MSTIAVIDLDWDGHGPDEIQTLPHGIFLALVFGLYDGLQMKGSDRTRSTEGQVAMNRVGDRRNLLLAGQVSAAVGSTEDIQQASFYNQMDLVRSWFDLRFTKVLTANCPDGTVRTINARPTAISIVQIVPAMAEVTIPMESVDPDWVIVEGS